MIDLIEHMKQLDSDFPETMRMIEAITYKQRASREIDLPTRGLTKSRGGSSVVEEGS